MQSFKTAKIIKLGSEKPFASVLLVMNGEHMVLSFSYSEDQSQASMEPVIQGLARRIESLGLEPPRVLYTDQCCRDRDLVTKVFPSLRDERGIVEGGDESVEGEGGRGMGGGRMGRLRGNGRVGWCGRG